MKLRYKLRTCWKEIELYFRKLKAVAGNNVFLVGRLYATKINNGKPENLGLISTELVTDAGIAAVVDAFQDTFELEDFKYHGSGTGTTAADASDTALETEVESRATGSQTEGATADIYKTVGTVAYTASRAVTEWGLLSASSSGTLFDRAVFTAINVTNGATIQFTYELTVS